MIPNCKNGTNQRTLLNEWEINVHEHIDKRIQQLRAKHINKRKKKHVFKDKLHLDYLEDLHNQFVLVPADKAANNVIIVCKKYYMEMVLDKLNATQTYFKDNANIAHIISKHVKYMNKNNYQGRT